MYKKPIYPVFEVAAGVVSTGSAVVNQKLANDCELNALSIGEHGKGRRQGFLIVRGRLFGPKLYGARLGTTQKGMAALDACGPPVGKADHAIVVLRTPIGYKGSNMHTGDRVGPGEFLDFPGKLIVYGKIAEGEVGDKGAGNQYISLIPAGVTFRTGYTGRLFGAVESHYYIFDGEKIIAKTWMEKEREAVF